MADRFMYNPNDDTQNYSFCRLKLSYWLKRLDTQVSDQTNRLSMEVPNIVEPTYKETFGASAINMPIFNSALKLLHSERFIKQALYLWILSFLFY